jgi:CheY-like chemotaxis protein
MSDEQKAQLFQPFNRLGRERSTVEGTGIGLVLVRQLVGLLAGELTLETRAGESTVVRVSLPATDNVPVPLPRTDDALAGIDSEASGVVLYVEDNPVNVILVEQLMARWPRMSLVTVNDGASGLAKARELHPDVVLLDMQLPDMTGLDVLRGLKADQATRDIPVVALSAGAVLEDVAAARAAGALDYWTKPIDFDAFIAGMGRLLGRRPAEEPRRLDPAGSGAA